jgi:hypothetical protein
VQAVSIAIEGIGYDEIDGLGNKDARIGMTKRIDMTRSIVLISLFSEKE